MNGKNIIITALALWFCGTPALAGDGIMQVQFKALVTMDTDDLTLRDLVDSDNTDLDFITRYGNIKIDDLAPEADKVNQAELMGLLYGAGADMDKILFKKGATVKLERGQKIDLTTDQIAKIADVIAVGYNVPRQDVAATDVRILPKLDELALDGFKIVSAQPKELANLDRAKIAVMLEDFDGNRSTHILTMKLKIETVVVSAAEDIAAGTSLGEQQTVAGRTPLKTLKGRIVTAGDIKGKAIKTVTELKKGEILTADAIRESEIIKKGALVTLSYKSDAINIKAQGMLIDNAEIGSVVSVENIDSKRTVTGILISRDNVEVASAK